MTETPSPTKEKDVLLPRQAPRVVKVKDWKNPPRVKVGYGDSITWELEADSGVTVGIAFPSPLDDAQRGFGPFVSLELSSSPLESGRHRVRITGLNAGGVRGDHHPATFNYVLRVLTEKDEPTLLETELDPTTSPGELVIDNSGRPPGEGPWNPCKPGKDCDDDWRRVFLKLPPAARRRPPRPR